MSRQRMRSDSRNRVRATNNMSRDSGKSSRISLSNWVLIPSLDVSCIGSDIIGLITISSVLNTVVAEPVVGATTGALPAPKGYFKAMRSVCKKYGALYILDEVMCGMGRKFYLDFSIYPKIEEYLCRNGNHACMAE